MSKDCPAKSGRAEYGRPAPTTSVRAQGDNTDGPQDKKKLIESFKELMKEEDVHQEIFDHAMDLGFV